MKTIVSIIQLVTAAALVILVLLQDRGEGLSETFGGGGGGFSVRRRGLEKIVYIATIASIVIFAVTSLANLLL
jgi:protein translocase SecG subunit